MEELLINDKNKISDLEEEKKQKIINKLGSADKDIYARANCLSKMFFYWAYKIIKLSNIMPLKSEYLGVLEGKNLSRNYYQDIETVWETKNYKNLKKHALMKASIRANMCSLIIMVCMTFLVASFEFSAVYLFRVYIKMFQKDYIQPNEYYTKLNVGVLFLSIKVLSTFVSRQASIFQSLLGFKASNELNCMIFNKVLKASPASMREKSGEGEIINFLQVDSSKLAMVMTYCPTIFIIPVQIIVYTYMLFEFMGISFLFGFITLAIFLAINFFIQGKYRILQKEMLKMKDSRMKVTTETFNSLKVLKLYGWEDEFLKRIETSRNDELSIYSRVFKIANFNLTLLWFAPIAVSIASIGAYQFLTDEMRIEDIFTCLNIFNAIQEPIRNLPWIISNLLELVVSMGRVQKFLLQEEIKENQIAHDDIKTISEGLSINIENGNFSWGLTDVKKSDKKDTKNKNDNPGKVAASTSNPSKYSTINNSNDSSISLNLNPEDIADGALLPDAHRIILKNINLEIMKGEFVCIIGDVGSGKSSLLQAILNNMLQVEVINGQVKERPSNSLPQVTVNGTFSYVSQIPWIQNDTVKNNIIFHSAYDENKYNYVLNVCELRPDLEVLVGGDMTEIGEKGINLSGGQKARISIARAIYADNDIFLFDDPISALDAHVGQSIMKNLIVKDLGKKTRLLVTHALQYLSYADRIIYMENGEIKWQGYFNELNQQDFFAQFKSKLKSQGSVDKEPSIELENESEETNKLKEEAKEEKKEKKEVTRITKDEDKEEGKVKSEVYYTYIKYMGGFSLFILVLFVMCTWQTLKGSADMWLTYWTKHQSKEDNLFYYFVYAGLGASSAIFVFMRVFLLTRSSLKCTKRLHEEMIEKLVHAPINLYHDTIPKGQILNRLSKDITNLDAWAMFAVGWLISSLFSFLGAIVICAIIEPYSLVFIPFLFLVGFYITKFYTSANRDLSRLDGITRSPIINLLAETIPGAITIRAFGLSHVFSDKFNHRADDYYKIRHFISGTSQWFGIVLDLLSVTFFIFLIVFTILFEDFYSAQGIGILLTYSLSLQSSLFSLLSVISGFENCMVSMERCLKYTHIPSELPRTMPIDDTLSEWPKNGQIEFRNYSVRYRPETDIVLKDLNFVVNPGEKVGVVGRTGSGKSTLCLSLFRILEPTVGTIYIDDVDIKDIGLKKLRSALTIIPQDPNLMQGTLKYNIDPLCLYSDEEIASVMKSIGFWYICERDEKGLLQPITDNGNNLSVGEKQLICITRAILRKSKIVVMDEATANIDMRTEEIIQKAINEILSSSTVITIAHRIKTIIHYDRILVLSNGEMVEYDSPQKLIKNKESLFYELYKKSNI